MGNKKRSVRV